MEFRPIRGREVRIFDQSKKKRASIFLPWCPAKSHPKQNETVTTTDDEATNLYNKLHGILRILKQSFLELGRWKKKAF